MALALIRLQDYEKAISCLQEAIQEYPENIIYAANYEILKWICGAKHTLLSEKYNCGCEAVFNSRLTLGLWMLDELTLMIDKNEIKSNNEKNSSSTVKDSTKILLDKLL
jgi:tetratricopeptide (TPR) repeat protein